MCARPACTARPQARLCHRACALPSSASQLAPAQRAPCRSSTGRRSGPAPRASRQRRRSPQHPRSGPSPSCTPGHRPCPVNAVRRPRLRRSHAHPRMARGDVRRSTAHARAHVRAAAVHTSQITTLVAPTMSSAFPMAPPATASALGGILSGCLGVTMGWQNGQVGWENYSKTEAFLNGTMM